MNKHSWRLAPLIMLATVLLVQCSPAFAADGYSTSIYKEGGGNKMVVGSGGEIEVQSGATLDMQSGASLNIHGLSISAAEAGYLDGASTANSTASVVAVLDANKNLKVASGNGSGVGGTVAVAEYGVGDVIHKTVITCTATTVTISDDAGVAQYGGVKLYDFPEGSALIHGAVINGALTAGVTGTIIDGWSGGVALGSATATTGATLTGTEADLVPEVNIPAATLKVGTAKAYPTPTALTESGARWVDGTSTPIDLYLNFVIDDDATHTAGTATFTGTITVLWSNLGDV